jgi:hypothetical protein
MDGCFVGARTTLSRSVGGVDGGGVGVGVCPEILRDIYGSEG